MNCQHRRLCWIACSLGWNYPEWEAREMGEEGQEQDLFGKKAQWHRCEERSVESWKMKKPPRSRIVQADMSKPVTWWEEENGTLLLVSLKRSVEVTPGRVILMSIKWNILLLSSIFKISVTGRRKKRRAKLRLEMKSPLGFSHLR